MARIQNKERLRRKLGELPPKVRQALAEPLGEGANEIANAQRRLVPVRSGALRDSIKVSSGTSKDPNSVGVKIAAGDTGETRKYAALVEFGTPPHVQGGQFAGSQHPGTTAQPFFFPPYRAYRKRVKGKVTRAGKKAIKEVAGR